MRIIMAGAKRTPFGRYQGALSETEPLDLGVHAARAALEAVGDAARRVDQVFVGNCIPGAFETASVTGRQLALRLGLDVFATTIDTACCSPLTALRMALWGLRLGEIRSALVVGVESMSRVPHVSRQLRAGVRIGEVKLTDPIFPITYPGYNSVAVDAADGAERHGVSKRMLDAFAMGSHLKWAAAARRGRFADELAPLRVKKGREALLVAEDEQPRPDGSLARLALLPPVFGSKTTTAGNAPGLNDGAAAVVVMTEERARETGAPVLAELTDQSGVTDAPNGISWVPALAIRKVLERNALRVDQLELLEINEAFAAMPLVSTKLLAEDDEPRWLRLLERTNVNGGAVAIGHPVGASGLRILMTLAYELRRRGGGRGVAAICGGLTQGEAALLTVAAEGGAR
jgi:acetyl-CoA C-acetyltransferase